MTQSTGVSLLELSAQRKLENEWGGGQQDNQQHDLVESMVLGIGRVQEMCYSSDDIQLLIIQEINEHYVCYRRSVNIVIAVEVTPRTSISCCSRLGTILQLRVWGDP